MQDLKYFVDIVESVHSGGASLFGLKTAQISQLLLHSHEKHHWVGILPSPQYHNNWFHPSLTRNSTFIQFKAQPVSQLDCFNDLNLPKQTAPCTELPGNCLPPSSPLLMGIYPPWDSDLWDPLPFSRSYFVVIVVVVVVVNNIFFALAAGFQSFRQTQS